MSSGLADAVRSRAKRRFEYCRFPEAETNLRFSVDHIRPLKHGGPTLLENLALACPSCNAHKGTNLSGIDRKLDAVSRLFDPRTDKWTDHFRWESIRIVGLSSVGRATIAVLAMNDAYQIAARRGLSRSGWFFRADL